MRILTAFAILVVALSLPVFAAEGFRPFLLSGRTQIDIPLQPDPQLFAPSGGAGLRFARISRRVSALSAGVSLDYHLARLKHEDFVDLGTLSVIAVGIPLEYRPVFRNIVEFEIIGEAGYFGAVLNGDVSSHATNIMLIGGVGIGLRLSPALSVGIRGEYRRYRSLYHMICVGFDVDLWRGGCK